MATARPTPGRAGARTRAGGGPGQGRRRWSLPLGSASTRSTRWRKAFSLPFTLGHENAGWVEKMGPGATGFTPGDPVIVYGPWGCGLCMNCRQRHGELLPDPRQTQSRWPRRHRRRDGRVCSRSATRYLIPLGDLDPREAAPLSDAGLTSYHAVKRSVHLLGTRVHRSRHRGRRSRADGHPDAQGTRPRRQPLSPWTPRQTS